MNLKIILTLFHKMSEDYYQEQEFQYQLYDQQEYEIHVFHTIFSFVFSGFFTLFIYTIVCTDYCFSCACTNNGFIYFLCSLLVAICTVYLLTAFIYVLYLYPYVGFGFGLFLLVSIFTRI